MEDKRLTPKDWHNAKFTTANSSREVLKRLWDLENKIENRTLIELPCKAGDVVYVFDSCQTDDFDGYYYVDSVSVNQITINSYGEIEFVVYNNVYSINDFGKKVFLTKAEAEARLNELQEKE